jgi:hypothetical protein
MSPGGTWAPLLSAAYRVHSIEASDRAERTMEGLLTSYLILTGGASDLSGSEIGPLIERYFRGGAPSTREHLRLIAVAADRVMTPFRKRSRCTNACRAAKSIACASVYTPNTNIRRRLSGCSDLSKQWEISQPMTLAFSLRAERFIPTAERLFGGYLVLILAADSVETLRILCQDRFFVSLA